MKICLFTIALAATLAAQQKVTPETVVAKIDGKELTAADVQKILDNTPELVNAFRQNPQLALGQYFLVKKLAADGASKNLDKESPWKEQIETRREQVLANAMANRERDGYPVSSEMMDAYYKQNQARYQQSKIKVIFVAFQPPPPTGTSPEAVKAAAEALFKPKDPNARTEDAARVLSLEIVNKARNGTDFGKLVEQYSDDATSKKAGGDFGTVKADSSLPEEIKRAVFAMKQGDVSEPVRQPTGFYVIRCEDKTAQPIDEVRAAIVQDIRQQHLREYLDALNQRFSPKVENQEFFQQAAGKH